MCWLGVERLDGLLRSAGNGDVECLGCEERLEVEEVVVVLVDKVCE